LYGQADKNKKVPSMNDNPLCAQAAFLAAPPRFSYPVFYLTGSCCLLACLGNRQE
jgi:hypothetical protein